MIGSITPYLTLLAAWLLQVFCFQYLVMGNGWLLPTFHLYGLILASADFVSVGPSFDLRIDRSIA